MLGFHILLFIVVGLCFRVPDSIPLLASFSLKPPTVVLMRVGLVDTSDVTQGLFMSVMALLVTLYVLCILVPINAGTLCMVGLSL